MVQSFISQEAEWLKSDNRITQSLKDQYECITLCTEVTSGKFEAFIAPGERDSLKQQCQETKDWIKSQQDLCNRNKDKSAFPFSQFDEKFKGGLGVKSRTEPVKTRLFYDQKVNSNLDQLSKVQNDLTRIPNGQTKVKLGQNFDKIKRNFEALKRRDIYSVMSQKDLEEVKELDQKRIRVCNEIKRASGTAR